MVYQLAKILVVKILSVNCKPSQLVSEELSNYYRLNGIGLKFLPVVDNIYIKGTVSQIIDIGSRFHFITKNGKLVVILFLAFILHFIK